MKDYDRSARFNFIAKTSLDNHAALPLEFVDLEVNQALRVPALPSGAPSAATSCLSARNALR